MKTFDWEDFKNRRIAVHCKTEQECNNFLEMAREHEIVLENSISLSERNFFRENGNNICYRFEFKKRLRYDISVYYKANGFTILEWSDYMEFSTDDLKAGMLVETSDGKALVMPCGDGKVLTYKNGYYDYLCDVEFDDISKVWGISNIGNQTLNFSGEFRRVIYERTAIKEMTVEEISKALGFEVKIVK